MSEHEIHKKIESNIKALSKLKDVFSTEGFLSTLLEDEEIQKNIVELEKDIKEQEKLAKKLIKAYRRLSDVGKAIVKTTIYNILFRDVELEEVFGSELYDFIMNPGKFYEEILRKSVQFPAVVIPPITVQPNTTKKVEYKHEECPKCKTKIFVKYDYEKRKKILSCFNCGFISIESI